MRFFSLSHALSAAVSTSALMIIPSNNTSPALSITFTTTAIASTTPSPQPLIVSSTPPAASITPAPSFTGSAGWQLQGESIIWPTDADNSIICSTDGEWATARGPCFAWCLNSACKETASSVAATCSPQWQSYINASEAWLQEHPATVITNYVTITNTSLEGLYTSTSTASDVFWTSRHGTIGETLSVENYHPIYVFGKPTGTSEHYITTVTEDVQSHWVKAENGFTTTITQSPFPTPPPFCDVTELATNFVGPESGCTEYINHCGINGGTVQLYYWPDQATAAANDITASAYKGNISAPNADPILATVSGFTMTSPTVYISLAQIYATDYCGGRIGKDYAGSIIPMNPGDVSSVARQGPFYIYGDAPASKFNYADLQGVVPAQAYADANMCWDTACYTITNDEYRPYLSIPPEIYALDPGWASCNPNFEGLYDPPMALQTAASVAAPTYPHARPKIAIAMATPAAAPAPPTVATPTPQATTSKQPDPTESPSPAHPAQEPAFHYDPQSSASRSSKPQSSSPAPPFSYDPQNEPSDNPPPAYAPAPSNERTHPMPVPSVAIGDLIAGAIGMTHDNSAPSLSPPSPVSPAQTQDSPPPPVITIGLQGYTALPSNGGEGEGEGNHYIIAGQTLQQNEAITAAGTTISLGAAGSVVVVNGETQDINMPQPTPKVLLVGDNTFTPMSSALILASQTIEAGGIATISGTTISYNPGNDMVIVNGQTHSINIPDSTSIAHATPHAIGVIIDGHTIRPGETSTIAGAAIAVDSGNNYVVIDGSQTEQISTMPTATPTPKVVEILTLGGQTYTRIGGALAGFTIDGQTLRPGQVVTVDEGTISLARTGGIVVVNGTTQALRPVTRPAYDNSTTSSAGSTTATTATRGLFEPFASVAHGASPTSTSAASGRSLSLWWFSVVFLLCAVTQAIG